MNTLKPMEVQLMDLLPGPPPQSCPDPNTLHILQWLPPGERETGLELHEWMMARRPGWSSFVQCSSKGELLGKIEILARTLRPGERPILHIEAHGNEDGLQGPDGCGGLAFVTWSELRNDLTKLNWRCQGHLIVVFAACIGFAGLLAFTEGPRAPAAAVIGPSEAIQARLLLAGCKEFYRGFIGGSRRGLVEMVRNASLETEGVDFEIEYLPAFAFAALAQKMILDRRPEAIAARLDRLRGMLESRTALTELEISERLLTLPKHVPPLQVQQMWDQLFFIDIYPENRLTFGISLDKITSIIDGFQSRPGP